jgi:hypothetical protein
MSDGSRDVVCNVVRQLKLRSRFKLCSVESRRSKRELTHRDQSTTMPYPHIIDGFGTEYISPECRVEKILSERSPVHIVLQSRLLYEKYHDVY